MTQNDPSDLTDLTGRVAVVTGAGLGLGRSEALALASAGADVVVNDVGDAAHAVVAEIEALGRRAVAVQADAGDWATGQLLVDAAVDSFGRLDVVVNNAGFTRDTMLFNMSEQQWDDVVRVHLKGHAALSRAAAVHFRAHAKETGAPTGGRIVNTASEAFLFGGPGQANYAAAKSGIVALTLSLSRGLARYGVTANAICPRARTAMTADVFAAAVDGAPDPLSPDRVGTFVAFLGSPAAAEVTGQVFIVHGDQVALLAPPTVEHRFTAADGTFSREELAAQFGPYFAGRDERSTFAAFGVLDATG